MVHMHTIQCMYGFFLLINLGSLLELVLTWIAIEMIIIIIGGELFSMASMSQRIYKIE